MKQSQHRSRHDTPDCQAYPSSHWFHPCLSLGDNFRQQIAIHTSHRTTCTLNGAHWHSFTSFWDSVFVELEMIDSHTNNLFLSTIYHYFCTYQWLWDCIGPYYELDWLNGSCRPRGRGLESTANWQSRYYTYCYSHGRNYTATTHAITATSDSNYSIHLVDSFDGRIINSDALMILMLFLQCRLGRFSLNLSEVSFLGVRWCRQRGNLDRGLCLLWYGLEYLVHSSLTKI